MTPTAGNAPATERRSVLSERQKKVMMQTLIRRKAAFESASSQLNADHFGENDRHLALLWITTVDLYSQFDKLPGERVLLAEIETRLEAQPDFLVEEEVQKLDALIRQAYRSKPADLDIKVALHYLRAYLEDQLAYRTREMFDSVTTTPEDMATVAEQLANEAAGIKALESTGIEDPFPADWKETSEPDIKRSTHMTFFDEYLKGGQVEQQVHLILGPYGSCKTTLAVQLSTREAKAGYLEWIRDGKKGPLPLVYYFFYEGSMDEMRVRSLSCLAEINRDPLEARAWHQLSTGRDRATLKDYERERFSGLLSNGNPVLGELERMASAQKTLNRCWRAVDMTGDDQRNRGRGKGLTDEIASIIRQDQLAYRARNIKTVVRQVIVDYLGAAVEAHISHFNKAHDKHLRHLVNRFPLHLVNKVAKPFRCPVWVLHQLSTEAQAYAPGVVPKITQSAEGRAVAENCHFAFVVGTKTPDHKCVLAIGKGRRVALLPPRILQIRGELCRVDDLNGEFVLDESSKQIVSRNDRRRIGGPGSDSVPVPGSPVAMEHQYSDAAPPTAVGINDSGRRRHVMMSQNASVRKQTP